MIEEAPVSATSEESSGLRAAVFFVAAAAADEGHFGQEEKFWAALVVRLIMRLLMQ